MIYALYITNKHLEPLFQYSTVSDSPTFQQLARKLQDRSQTWSNSHSTSLSSHKKVCKHHSSLESPVFWALCSTSTDSLQISAMLRDLELEIAHYFDKHELTQKKLTNNIDRLSMLCHAMLDASEPILLESSDLQHIIPQRTDLARFLKNTTSSLARVASTTRSRAPPSFSSTPSLDSFTNTSSKPKAPIIPSANEVLIDVIESFSAVCDSSGHVLRSKFNGRVDLTCSLPGSSPLLELLLIGGPFTNYTILNAPHHVSWHESVLIAHNSNHNVLSTTSSGSTILRLTPPSGKIRLCEYSLAAFAANSSPSGLVSLQIRKALGVKYDEFEIRLQISTSIQSHDVKRISVSMRFHRAFHGKIRVISSTHGRLENIMSRNISIWRLDTEMEGGTLAVLRCVSEPENSDNPIIFPIELQLQYEHSNVTASGFKVQSVDVHGGTAYNKPFKGVKYTTRADSVVYRTI